MKTIIWIASALLLVAGCMTSAPGEPQHWTIDFSRSGKTPAAKGGAAGSVRLSSVDVRAPYSGQRLAVLRPDGTLVFDAFNSFASSPSVLLKGAAFDAIEASGIFAIVLNANSAAKAEHSIEIVATELMLDCRAEGRRTACVELALTLLKDRTAVARVRARGEEDVEADYSVAFSRAFAKAMDGALGQLPVK